MWRVQGFVGRVLHRYHASVPLRLPQNHHVEDEVINTSTALSSSRHASDLSSQREEDGERRKRQRSFQFGGAGLPRYTTLDAVGLGAAAVLFMQICRRIHSRFSSGADAGPPTGAPTTASVLQKCGYRVLLEILGRNDVLPRGRSVLCLQSGEECVSQSSSSSSSSSSDSAVRPQSSNQQDHTDSSSSHHQGATVTQDSPLLGESLLSAPCPLQSSAGQGGKETKDANEKDEQSDEEKLADAALNLRHVGDTSVPVILNIIGLENAKSRNHNEAFTCFLAAAQQGYSKAQFNVGVCYEKGRGVGKDTEKALSYYKQAAARGHTQAQYRYAKLLLTSRGHQSVEELDEAISLLEQAAAAGLTKAQVCLASVYSQDPVRNERKSVQYLQMAAQSRDSAALLLLAQCYESGFGVQQNPRAALEFYKRAAAAGSVEARALLQPADTELLRSIRSSPCFLPSERRRLQPRSSPSGSVALPHSWSTGTLSVVPALSSTPLHLHTQGAEGTACKWTVGVG